MTNLSPQAQAIVDAYENTTDKYDALAAVLCAAADQVVPEQTADRDLGHSWEHIALVSDRMGTRSRLLAIANELEGK